MGVYQRAELWQDFQSQKSRYRDEMIKVFGGEPAGVGQFLHGRKGDQWVHVGPLDGAVSSPQIWSIAREAARTNTKAVTVLSADFDTQDGDPSRLKAIESPLMERFSRCEGLLVLNDEAHHVGDEPAHAQFEQRARDRAKLTPEAEEPLAEAMAWIRSLRRLHGAATAVGRIALQVDLSATLYAEAGATRKQGDGKAEGDALAFKPFDLFRHTAVRYDLKDAIPDGIVKKPILERVTVRNTATGDPEPLVRAGQPNAWEKYKNILVTGIERWKKVRRQLEEEGDPRKPILFILCDNRTEAKEIASYLKYGEPTADGSLAGRIATGFRDPRDPAATEPLFLFKDAAGDVHSTVIEIHIGEKENRSEGEWEKVRSAVNAIDHDTIPDPTGRKDSDGRPVTIPNPYNVVVSVMMLKEGWDVRNVKVIVPLRRCDSRTLTEQTLGRGLRKMHPPRIDDEGIATLVPEELYVIEHPSFKTVLDQIRDIVEEKGDEEPPREYVPVLQREDPAEREAFDVRLLRFEGLTQQLLDWRKSFDVGKISLDKKIPWRDEIADTEIQTFLKHALEQREEAGQTFMLEGTTSHSDFDHVIEHAGAVPVLKELRTSYQHKNAVKDVVREFLERRTFALPAGIPLRFGGAMEPDDARIALGNLARPEVIKAVKEKLLPELRKAMVEQRKASQAQLAERRGAELRNYQALRRNVVQALRRSSFQQAAVANDDERRVAILVDRATDVTGWLYNDRQGVGFSIPYDWHGRTSQYFPDFIVRAKLGQVFHNFIIEVKGRLDDRDRVKAQAGAAYCELLTEHDREPWHYLMLIENTPIGREDIGWWEQQSSTEIGDLLRHHESLPLLPEVSGAPTGRPFQILEARPAGGDREPIPVYDLAVAAGGFSASQTPEPLGWALLTTHRSLDVGMFVAQVTGRSMEEGIPDGSYCLFRAYAAGTAPSAVALNRRRVVVELREGAESDLGGRYTLKRWHVSNIDPDGSVSEIELRPDNRSYQTIRLRPSDGEIRVVAELLEVLG